MGLHKTTTFNAVVSSYGESFLRGRTLTVASSIAGMSCLRVMAST